MARYPTYQHCTLCLDPEPILRNMEGFRIYQEERLAAGADDANRYVTKPPYNISHECLHNIYSLLHRDAAEVSRGCFSLDCVDPERHPQSVLFASNALLLIVTTNANGIRYPCRRQRT